VWLAAVLAVLLSACGARRSDAPGPALAAAAEKYVRLVLALGERDADSLDSYHGPPAWQAEARSRRATLADIQTAARSLAESLAGLGDVNPELEGRRQFVLRQLRAVMMRIDILRGARPPVAEEARGLFGLDVVAEGSAADENDVSAASVRAAIDRLVPGHGDLAARYAAFDRAFLIAPDRLAPVLSRAIDGCRAATRAHVRLPAAERVEVEYVRALPWSAFTRYEGSFTSRIQINASLPLTVDRALDLACHEAYPGHHAIATLLDARFGAGRVELLVQPLFSPQSLLHEAAASLGGTLAFSDAARVAFERDELFPLAGLDPGGADRHVRVERLVDQLHGVHAAIARRYLDGTLDFPRASAALERDALMPSADATLKFLNQYRTYAFTYTLGRDALLRFLDARETTGDEVGRWRAYIDVATDPAQIVPSDPSRK
jgi:hypothetical protein